MRQTNGTRTKFWEGDTDVAISSTGDPKSFGYTTSRDRWPSILENVIKDVEETMQSSTPEKATEGKEIVAAVERLRSGVLNDAILEPLSSDEGGSIDEWNAELATFNNASWLHGPWLYVECLLYRRVHDILSSTKSWRTYDVFKRKKDSTFKKSKAAITELAQRYRALVSEVKRGITKAEARKLLFIEMTEISLWGNATDLSLLANLPIEDLEKLQGKKAIETLQKNIVVNDMEEAWKYFSTLQGAQIDIVLDNAGFELFVDVFLAAYFLEIGAAKTIICHPKDFGWFVSDVIPADFDSLFKLLEDESIADTPQEREDLKFLRQRWHQFYKSGRIQIRRDPFWTTAHPFWRMPTFAPKLYKALQKSDLVVYKGDLNYRKLIEDAWWPRTTKFVDALGTLGRGSGLKTLALRTSKADCFVGLESEKEEEEIQKRAGDDWTRSGKYAAISFYNGL